MEAFICLFKSLASYSPVSRLYWLIFVVSIFLLLIRGVKA